MPKIFLKQEHLLSHPWCFWIKSCLEVKFSINNSPLCFPLMRMCEDEDSLHWSWRCPFSSLSCLQMSECLMRSRRVLVLLSSRSFSGSAEKLSKQLECLFSGSFHLADLCLRWEGQFHEDKIQEPTNSLLPLSLKHTSSVPLACHSYSFPLLHPIPQGKSCFISIPVNYPPHHPIYLCPCPPPRSFQLEWEEV